MNTLRVLFEAIPVVFAVVAIFLCSNRVITTRRAHDRYVFTGMIVCAALLICAQSSWTYTVLHGLTVGTDVADVLWTIFNTATMTVFILATRRDK